MPPSRRGDGSQNGSVNTNGEASATSSTRKRQRDDAEEPATPPCVQCRSRKVRCDRQTPNCSNCRRAGVPCEYSNSSSRVYTIKEVLDEFSSVTSRLDRIETALTGIWDYIKRTPAALHSPPTTNGAYSAPHAHRDDGDESVNRHRNIEQLGDIEQSGGRIEECPAAFSLFRSLHRRLAASLEGNSEEPRNLWALVAQHPNARQALTRQLEIFPFDGKCVVQPVTGDSQPVTVPPRGLVEGCVGDYLENINAYTPIFDKDGLKDKIAFYYDSPPCQQSLAQALTLSNIYLLSVTLERRVNRASGSEIRSSDDDVDTVRVLLKNCDRALQDLESFCRPGLENLESLLTLALVCQEYYTLPSYARVCQAAVRLVRTMGFHQTRVETVGAWESISEPERLFWVAYGLDKGLVFLSGHPGDLYLFDCTPPLRLYDEVPTMHELHGAFNNLVTIWEDIFLSLYSVRATTAERFGRGRQIALLQAKLGKWKESHGNLLSKWLLDRAYHLKVPQIELQYAYHITQILIQRCDSSLSLQERYRDSSRQALELLSNFNPAHLLPSTCTILSRIFLNYPMVAFHDLFLYISLSDKKALLENAHLLYTTRTLLQPFQDPEFTESYCTRLYAGLTWCTEQLDILLPLLTSGTLTGGICPELDQMAEFDRDVVAPLGGFDEVGQLEQLNLGVGLSESFFDGGLFSGLL
ncbi:hypothetical protein BDV12DRAFT_171887 [Aspergillus spectabilis]